MVDERFSADAFERCGLDTQAAQDLADILADEIQREMHQVVTDHFLAIIERLNRMGHGLKPLQPPAPGEIAFRDEWEDETGYHCKLRVAWDSVISTGYSHLISLDSDANTDAKTA
jgi:hypothetical protein